MLLLKRSLITLATPSWTRGNLKIPVTQKPNDKQTAHVCAQGYLQESDCVDMNHLFVLAHADYIIISTNTRSQSLSVWL